uniref:Uncharacterized protein n=1 Tax=Parascaris univalens TaxID=6257 RepID=A0A915BT78_PARUN
MNCQVDWMRVSGGANRPAHNSGAEQTVLMDKQLPMIDPIRDRFLRCLYQFKLETKIFDVL